MRLSKEFLEGTCTLLITAGSKQYWYKCKSRRLFRYMPNLNKWLPSSIESYISLERDLSKPQYTYSYIPTEEWPLYQLEMMSTIL